jgi:ribose transport system ATP-binding protein
VLRGGVLIDTVSTEGLAEESLLELMLGFQPGVFYPDKEARPSGETVLVVDGLTGDQVADLSFIARAGEIVGVTGLAGMGQDEVPYLLVGAKKAQRGAVTIDGHEAGPHDPARALRRGLVLVPGNRQRDGAWRDGSVMENVTLPYLKRYFRGGRLRRRLEAEEARLVMDRFRVVPPDHRLPFRAFSGGNQQKILLSRALQSRPKVLALHEPTQGIDMGAKKDLLREIRAIATNDGCAIVVCTTEYEDLEYLCDRVVILDEGRMVVELTGPAVTEDRILLECHASAVAA